MEEKKKTPQVHLNHIKYVSIYRLTQKMQRNTELFLSNYYFRSSFYDRSILNQAFAVPTFRFEAFIFNVKL